MKNKGKKVSLREALRLHWRGVNELSSVLPHLFPALACQAATAALTPYALIYFSARILNELAGARRPGELWRWVIWAVAVNGVLVVLNALLTSWKNVQMQDFWSGRDRLFARKLFSLDYADMEKQSTRDLHAQIKQNEQWNGFGLPRLIYIVPDVVQAVIGIGSAVALTVSLFSSRVPASAGKLLILNNPLFIPALLALMLLFSQAAGKLSGYLMAKAAAISASARLGNRIFTYFGFTVEATKERSADVRVYEQYRIVDRYMSSQKSTGFGVSGPFARLARGLGGITYGLSASLSAIFTGFVYVFTCLKALARAFGVGSVTQYVGAVTALSRNLTTLFSAVNDLRANAEFLKQTFEFLDIPNAMYQGSLTTEKRSDRQYDIEFRDVSFRYPGSDAWALRHVNVRFQVGGRLAVVGENGSGKTTFIKLLCRLYDPQEGEILLNGIDIKKYNYRDYMDLFSVVFQDFQLLSQPLGDNVAGGTDWDEGRVLAALCDAGFGERLKTLPDGLRTQLYRDYGEEGVEISGGEAQKIAIARALYKNAPFLILDEPTAALDPIAEAEIYNQLDQITGDRTAIYISHRLSSCRFCDEILVFDHGQIVQRGTHEVLVNDEAGKYHTLWHAQAQYYQTN